VRSAVQRLSARVRHIGLPTLDDRRTLSAYWSLVTRRARRFQWFRLNPVTFAWNATRDVKNLAIFVTAMTQERH
jgi:hypothetical protein